MSTSRYKGFSILARPYQLQESRHWTVDLEIRRSGRCQVFSTSGLYRTEHEAAAHCYCLAHRIIDGADPRWSVDYLRGARRNRRRLTPTWMDVSLRQLLDLYACVRPVRWFEGVPSPVKHPEWVDVVIFRENSEDIYVGLEHPSGSPEAKKLIEFVRKEFSWKVRDDAGVGLKTMSPFGTKRLVRKALRYAVERHRKSLTIVHKGNIMKYTEGAFAKWGYELAREEFGDQTVTWDEVQKSHGGKTPAGKVLVQDYIADVTFQHLLTRPRDLDVIATGNLNGDYLSDAVAAQVGGIGMAPGANISDFHAIFEATHGTAPKYANLDKVNPGSLTLSGVMMLEYLGWNEAAQLIVRGLEKTFQQKVVTYDLARLMDGAKEVKTSEFASAVIDNMG